MADGEVSTVPEYYREEIRRREQMYDACPIDIYVSSINPRWGHPHKLMSYARSSPTVAESSRMLIIDSGFRQVGDMDEIIAASEKTDADWLIPPDVTPFFPEYDKMGSQERVEELWRDLQIYQEKRPETGVLIPVHRPVVEHIDYLRNYDPGYVLGLEDDPYFDWPDEGEEWRWNARGARPTLTCDFIDAHDGVAIALKRTTVHERIEIIEEIDRCTPSGTYVHLLSPGTEPEMLQYLRENPQKVDSLDVSTPETAPANGKLPDKTWTQHRHLFPTGKDSTTVRAQYSAAIAAQLAYMLTPELCTDEMFEELKDNITAEEDERDPQQTLAGFE